MGYTMDPDPKTTAKAYGKELRVSPKKSYEVCNMIRGKDIDTALNILDDIIEKKRAVPYKRHKKQAAHNKGVGPGGYPIKAAKIIKETIEEARSNAEDKGLDSEDMKILSIAAHRGSPTKGNRPRAMGRSTPFHRKTTNLEVILQVREEV